MEAQKRMGLVMSSALVKNSISVFRSQQAMTRVIAPARVASECVEAFTYPLVSVTPFPILRKRSKNLIATSAVYLGGWGGMRRCSPGTSVQPGWEGGEAVCSLVAAAGGHGGGNMWCGGAGGWGGGHHALLALRN